MVVYDVVFDCVVFGGSFMGVFFGIVLIEFV